MIQYRYDAARQPVPATALEARFHHRQAPSGPEGQQTTRRPGLPGGMGSGVPCHALLRSIERALIEHDIAASRFGWEAANDPSLVMRMRRNPSCTPAMRDKIMAYIGTLDSWEE